MDVIKIGGEFFPADVRVVELVDSLHNQVITLEAENAQLKADYQAQYDSARQFAKGYHTELSNHKYWKRQAQMVGWISVDDRLPYGPEPVLCMHRADFSGEEIWCHGIGAYVGGTWARGWGVTHWMPLPSPPAAVGV